MLLWMAYAAVVAGLLGAGGLALERICETLGWPRRLPWLMALTLALVVPLTATPGPPGDAAANSDGTSATGATQVVRPAAGPVAEQERATPFAVPLPTRTDRAALLLWGVASLAVFGALGAVLLASAVARRRWRRRRIDREEVYVSRDFGPGLVGVMRPVIVIPRWVIALGAAARATAVKHEREHARGGDHLTLLYSGLAVAAFPWSPAVWWMCRRLRAAIEIDCDRRVIGSGISAAEYGSLLLGIGAMRPRRQVFALTLAGRGTLLERRLRTMSAEDNGRKQMNRTGLGLLAGVVAATVVVACEVPPPTAIAPAAAEVLVGGGVTMEERVSGAEVAEQVRDMLRSGGVISSPSLSPEEVASADPLVLLDGAVLVGGLAALPERDFPAIMGISHYTYDPDRFGHFAGHELWGVVLINTVEAHERGEARWWPPVQQETLP